jgi:hypothetical protein
MAEQVVRAYPSRPDTSLAIMRAQLLVQHKEAVK